MVKAHKENVTTIVETACFLEPHASGLMHHNCLVRADTQYKSKQTAETLFKKYKTSVSFGSNVRTWAEGVVYGCVGSDHKKREELDKTPTVARVVLFTSISGAWCLYKHQASTHPKCPGAIICNNLCTRVLVPC